MEPTQEHTIEASRTLGGAKLAAAEVLLAALDVQSRTLWNSTIEASKATVSGADELTAWYAKLLNTMKVESGARTHLPRSAQAFLKELEETKRELTEFRSAFDAAQKQGSLPGSLEDLPSGLQQSLDEFIGQKFKLERAARAMASPRPLGKVA